MCLLAARTGLQKVRTVRGPVDIVLFEGWRVGIQHPNFEPFNSSIDLLLFLKARNGSWQQSLVSTVWA